MLGKYLVRFLGLTLKGLQPLPQSVFFPLPLFQFQEMVAYSDTVSSVVFNGPLGVTWNANEWALTA